MSARRSDADIVDIDPALLRSVLSHLPTGVTVVTAHCDDRPVGMAANSVTSVSPDPPLILFCPAKSSTTWPSIRSAPGFCVNILAGHHEDAARRFADESPRYRLRRPQDQASEMSETCRQISGLGRARSSGRDAC